MLSIRKRYRVDRKSVCWIRFIIEAYDGIAQVSTTDAYEAEIEIRVPPGCEDDVDALIDDLRNDIIIEPVAAEHGDGLFAAMPPEGVAKAL